MGWSRRPNVGWASAARPTYGIEDWSTRWTGATFGIMYIPAAFASEDVADILAFVARYPLAAVVPSTPGAGLYATHLPLLSESSESSTTVLMGHMARANPHWRELGDAGCDAIAIFTGPDAYVTPNWYASKQEHGRVVPTWNYAVVHAQGRLRVCPDQSGLRRHLEALTAHHEAGRPSPWGLGDTPDGFVEQQMQAIVAVEFTVARWEGKWKMSQNRSASDIHGVIHGLAGETSAESRAVGALVAERCPAGKRTGGRE